MELSKHRRLRMSERVIIETLLGEKKSKTYIAKRLKRAPSTISREVNKWVGNSKDKYDAYLANWSAKDDYLNKRNLGKIEGNSRLRFFVYKSLLKRHTPEQIAGRLKLLYPKDYSMQVSYETIYAHIYNRPQAKLNKKLIKLLTRGKTRRYSTKGSKKRKVKIKGQVSIDDRPIHIENRTEIGHWEGDLVIGVKQASAIGTLVERKSRYTFIMELANRKSKTVTDKFAKTINKLDDVYRKTMTYDNGVEMARHENFTKKTGMSVYFAHPYSSWERGTNENTNGLIRRYLPKGTDFRKITSKQLQEIQEDLNNRPRKILGFRTPNEVMFQTLIL